MTEDELRQRLAMHGRSLYERGLVSGSSGNISARLEGGMLLTPTSSCLGRLDPQRLSKLDARGRLVSGDKPTKEAFLHKAFYEERPEAGAVVHLHSAAAVAVSCLADLDERNVLPPLTPPQVVYVGELPLVPYFPPGCTDLAEAVRSRAREHRAMLLANHGPVVSGESLDAAVYAAEEVEEAAKVFLLLRGRDMRVLDERQLDELRGAHGG